MKSAPQLGEASASFPAASASSCADPGLRQTLKPHVVLPPGDWGGLGGLGDFQLRINPFVSLFAASLIAFLPVHALAQTAPDDNAYEREEAVSVRDRDRPEFDTEGRRVGAFVLRASLDLAVTSSDNIFAADEASELDDIIYSVTPSASLSSDWSRHALAIDGSLTSRTHDEWDSEDGESYYARAAGRFDIGDSTALRGSTRISHQVTPRTDPDVPETGAPVEYDRTDVGAGIEHRFARMTVAFDVGRSEYEYDGAQADRDNEQTTLNGRLDWEVSPRLGFFARASADEREYEPAYSNRDSDNRTYMAGVTVNTDLMRGEVSVGQFERDYTDPAIGTLDGVAVAGELEWYVTQLTTLTFTARRDANDQISANDRLPYITTEYGARIDHELRRNIILTASARLGERDFEVANPDPRHDDYSEAEIGADWLLNRQAAVRFRYERDEVNSSGFPASRDYEVNAITVGLLLRM